MICATCETETVDTPCSACGNDALLVGKYRLERVLGRGSQGTTFLATGPDGPCAIKELHLGRAGVGKRAELIHREASVLEQISHPFVPSLHEHFVVGVGVARSLYLVQDHVQGDNLEERLTTHRFTQAEVIDIIQQVGSILTALHALSPPVIHRDIKPSNLMVDGDGRVHLIDFGSVRDVMRDTVGGGSTVTGTFGYMPQEQLVGDATPASDIYALGMTAVRLLTRQQPVELTDRTGTVTWRPHAHASDEVGDWVDAMVHNEPTLRATAQLVADGPAGPPVRTEVDVPQALPPVIPSTSQQGASVEPVRRTPQRFISTPQVQKSVTQSGVGVIQFVIPAAFSIRDVQRLTALASKRRLLPANLVARPVGNAGGRYHLSTRSDGQPIGNGPWMVVQTHKDETTVLIQPLSQSESSVAPILVACAVFVGTILWGPIGRLDVMGPNPSLIWWFLGVVGLLIAAGFAIIGGMRPQIQRSTSVDMLKQDIIEHWATSTPPSSLPVEAPHTKLRKRERPEQTIR